MEIWKDVKGYEGTYQVSNLGIVRSLDHFVPSRCYDRVQKGRTLKLHKSNKGYLRVSLSKKGFRCSTGAHRLVAIAFIPNPKNKMQVNHINGIKDDNNLTNLEWCTNSENQIHAANNNLLNPNHGEKHHNSKLKNNEVVQARALNKKGWTNVQLSKKYQVSPPAMSKILRNETYINIK